MKQQHSLRIIKGSWGIAIDLVARCEHPPAPPNQAKEVVENVWLMLDDESWTPSQFERDALSVGIHLVRDELERCVQLPLLVRITKIEYRPSDYQEEGLALALAGYLSEEFGLSVPSVKVTFDRKLNRYLFENPLFDLLANVYRQ